MRAAAPSRAGWRPRDPDVQHGRTFRQARLRALPRGEWGVEGFFEALSDEVAPFGIKTTVLAPGRFPTSFYIAAEPPEPHPAYASHPQVRREPSGADEMPGDPRKIADLVVAIGAMPQPPCRLLLGSDAYTLAHESLTARLRLWCLEDRGPDARWLPGLVGWMLRSRSPTT